MTLLVAIHLQRQLFSIKPFGILQHTYGAVRGLLRGYSLSSFYYRVLGLMSYNYLDVGLCLCISSFLFGGGGEPLRHLVQNICLMGLESCCGVTSLICVA